MTCKKIEENDYLTEGWGCCACLMRIGSWVFNGWQRHYCKVCGHVRCKRDESEKPS